MLRYLNFFPPKLTPKNMSIGQFAFWLHLKHLARARTVQTDTTCGTNWCCWQFKKKGWDGVGTEANNAFTQWLSTGVGN